MTLSTATPKRVKSKRIKSDQMVARPIDLAHLARYTLGNRTLEREILELFRGQAEHTLARLRSGVDAREWVELTHALKGSARGVGAWQVAAAAEEAERLGNAADTVASLDRVAAALTDASVFIDEVFGEY